MLDKCKLLAYNKHKFFAHTCMTNFNPPFSHDYKDKLRKVALKATPTRVAILRLLEESNKPIDVAMIHSHLEKSDIETNPATVFRIMNSFTQKGLTRQVHFNEGKARYELASSDDHHHLICQKCGKIEDVSDCNIDMLEKEIAKKKQFLVQNHALEYFGLCKRCQH